MSENESDYIFESSGAIKTQIAALGEKAREARIEADHARSIGGLVGPASTAEASAERLEAQIADLQQVVERIERGFPYWERDGLEDALGAYGEPWRWDYLAEVFSPELVMSHEGVDVRMPVEAQRAYALALESGLFDRFEICSLFEADGDVVLSASYYLFGTKELPTNPDALFYVANW